MLAQAAPVSFAPADISPPLTSVLCKGTRGGGPALISVLARLCQVFVKRYLSLDGSCLLWRHSQEDLSTAGLLWPPVKLGSFSGPGQGIKELSLWLKGTAGNSIFAPSLNFLKFLCCSIMTPQTSPYRAETAKSALPFVPCIIHCSNSRRIIGAHRHHHRCNIQHTSVNIQLILNLKNEIKSINSYSQNSVKWICGKRRVRNKWSKTRAARG